MADRQTRAKKRWLFLPYALAAAIVSAYFLLWREGAHEMKKAIAQWAADQRAAGVEIEHGAVHAEGFPFFLRVHVDAPDISVPGAWAWHADRLTLDALPYDLHRLIFSATGEQTFFAKEIGEWRIGADVFRASVADDNTRGWVLGVTINNARARRTTDGATAVMESMIFDLAPDPTEKTTLTLNLDAQDVQAKNAGAEFSLSNVKTSLALTRTDALYAPASVDAWRASGGSLIIRGFIAQLEDARLSTSGELALDAATYPAGRLHAEMTNPAAFAELLEKTGALKPDEARAAGAGLTLAAMAGGGKIIAPIEMKNGAAKIAGVKIADLPSLK